MATLVISSTIGVATLLVLMREVFHQLLHPEGRGTLSVAIMRTGRGIGRRLGDRAMRLAGPLSLAAVLAAWYVLAVVGWTLVLYPHMPEGFTHAGDPPRQHPMLDATYLSVVTISTLGYGDIVPDTALLRLVAPLESVMGFGLLTASLTWLLSMYAPLARHRTVARAVHQALELEDLDGPRLRDVSMRIVETTIDLKMSSSLYYFHAEDERECLARHAVQLLDRARTIEADPGRGFGAEARALVRALDELAELLARDHLRVADGTGTRAILEAWSRDDAPRASGS